MTYLTVNFVDDVSIWWQIFNSVFLPLRRWFQFNSRIVRTHFASVMILNNWKNYCGNAKLHFQVTFLLSSTSSLLKFFVYETMTTHQIRSMIGWMRKNERAAHFFALFSDLICQTNDVQVPNLRFGRQRNQAPVVQTVDNAIHRINHYPLDIAIGFAITYPVDSDLSDG